jgi:putative DNA primase/helicase
MSASTMDRARGRWREILPALGIPKDALNGKHQACPACGGTDRFRFTDFQGDGGYCCNGCGNGSGINLLMAYQGWSFSEAAREIDKIIGREPEKDRIVDPKIEERRRELQRVWSSGRPVTAFDPAGRYLNWRLRKELELPQESFPKALRFVTSLPHFDPPYASFPAMVARFVDRDGRPVTLQRYYLTRNGQKAPGVEFRGMMPYALESLPAGSCVPLGEVTDTMGIAEGVETALSASLKFGIPVWAALNAGLLKQWRPPRALTLRRVVVFGDNDKTRTGQSAAEECARRLIVVEKIPDVDVKVFPKVGGDWNDAA